MPHLTIFTPTYNRAHTLHRLYQSLKRQTIKNFEWLIIDDGSTDNTRELIKAWQSEIRTFDIKYHWQENAGKCSAINLALKHAVGQLFFTVDSDDYLTDDAVEKITRWECELPKDKKYCGFAGNLGTGLTETSNSIFANGYYDGSPLDRYSLVDGERAMVFFTDVHKNYLYPIFNDEKFMTEAVTWNRMAADDYKMRFYNDIIWIYEYLDDGLTKSGNSVFINNPKGYGLWLKELAQITHKSFKQRLRMYYTFTCDLSKKYEPKFIAECIGAPKLLIYVNLFLHNFLQKFKRKKNKMNPILSIKNRFVYPKMQAHFEKTSLGKNISQYRNKFEGKRCFIVANGPSLTAEDLDLLHQRSEYTFGMNRIYKMFEKTDWRPTFYVCEDELIAKEQQAEINAIPTDAKFIPIELKWWHDIDISNALYFHLNYNDNDRCKYSFSPDIAHQIDCRGTVTFTCMQIAAYMGFSEIYLLGVDHNYQRTIDINGNVIVDPNAKDYFCEGYDSDIKDIVVHDMGNNTRAYMDAKAYCDETNKTTIYNATRGGKLEVFERVEFDSLFDQR